MAAAGVLLTGGASRRMGRDKAALRVDPADPTTLAARTAGLLVAVTEVAVEVGPGHTALVQAAESRPGEGPLAALVAGWEALVAGGWATGPVVVVATDLPRLSASLLEWLVAAGERGAGAGGVRSVVPVEGGGGAGGVRSVVPVDGGRPQPLCACYLPADLDVAVGLVTAGHRSMADLLARIDPWLAQPSEWLPAAGSPDALTDIDTPGDLERLLCRPAP